MKKRLIVLSTVIALSVCAVAGCGNQVSPASAQEAATAAAQNGAESAEEASSEAGEEELIGMANPWVDITEEEANAECTRLFKAPDGAKDVSWMKCDGLGDPEQGVGPLIQLSFYLDDMNFTARAQQGAEEDKDIAGNYVDWTVGPEDVTLANWGEGNMKGKTYRSVNDSGYVDMITWYDIEIGIAYSLSVAADDLEGFDIQAVAEQMYCADNEPMQDYPEDFLQEQSGILSFETYDDVIAALTPGQGYAYIKLQGCDDELLAVTDLVFEADHSAYEASIYGMRDGEAHYMGIVTGNGSAYPLRLADGILYGGDNHNYETYFVAEDTQGLMMQASIMDSVATESGEFIGFTRESNSFAEETKDFTGGQDEFDKLVSEREKKPIIEFTMVE